MGIPHSDGTVGKALSLLEEVAAYERPVRFAEVLGKSDLPKATLYRLLQTLTNQRMLSYDADQGTYSLGIRLIRLAHGAWRQNSLAPSARRHLDLLSSKLGETVHLAQLDNGAVLYVDKRNATRPIPMFSDAGKIGPGHCTGVGKAMMAFLPDDQMNIALMQQSWFAHTHSTITSADAMRIELGRIRDEGISYDREEHEPNIICIAAPILTTAQRPIGAISVTSSTLRHSLDDLSKFAPALRATAAAIAQDAASWAFPESA